MKINYLSSDEPRKRAAKTRPQFSGRTWYSDGKDVKKYPKTHQSMSILDNICHVSRPPPLLPKLDQILQLTFLNDSILAFQREFR